jgi:nucleoside-diphosphate-sugar epimerase
MTKVLVTGAMGQIGCELVAALRSKYGSENVVAGGYGGQPAEAQAGPFELLDVTDRPAVEAILKRQAIDTIYHLATILSASGESQPQLAWNVNIGGLRNVLEAAHARGGVRVFWPSSIAVFGPETPSENTPQDTVMRPGTMYGVTKVAGELLCDYYARHLGLDVRGLRFPGIISSEARPHGGTTDYAVEIFYAAITQGHYTCFVRPDTVLPMMYMPDALRAAIDLMEADRSRLVHRNGFNVAAMRFSAAELAAEIRKHLPGFKCEFRPDFRQAIADSWPRSLDDSAARAEWGWRPQYDLAMMTEHMLARLRERQQQGQL